MKPASPNRTVAKRTVAGWVLAAGTAAVLGLAVVDLPREGAALPRIARQAMTVALPQWRTTEPVSEVVYGTRAFDTFGETFLLLAAVVSVLLLGRHRERRREYFGEEEAGKEEQQYEHPWDEPVSPEERKARAADRRESGAEHDASGAMTGVVRLAVRIVAPVLGVAGFYLVLEGYSPGGGFPAGVVMVGLALLAYAGFGYRRIARLVRPGPLEVLELVGALLVIVVLALGLVLAGSFGANWLPLAPEQTLRSGGTMQAFSLAELIEVGTGLTIVIFSFLAIRHDWTPEEPDQAGGEGEEQ
ncbi:MnhB domain-containing protein [Kribbella sp.]|uniref:MnhB domain-containing protein n=1 Tax=Kribbella sp. TaxID=1871183 RepID=UPI002D3C2D23|nr:MnhB domain-containing protein [Kribbella sp.]HZX07604.1 MnhB domain-containing protein [Kribbella sp.]